MEGRKGIAVSDIGGYRERERHYEREYIVCVQGDCRLISRAEERIIQGERIMRRDT